MQADEPDHRSYLSRTRAAKAGALAAGIMGRIMHHSAAYREVRSVCGGIDVSALDTIAAIDSTRTVTNR